jgi:hypothetical protein
MSAPPPDPDVLAFYARMFYKLLVSMPKAEDVAEDFHSRDIQIQRATERELRKWSRDAALRFIPKSDKLRAEGNPPLTPEVFKTLLLQVISEVLDEHAKP